MRLLDRAAAVHRERLRSNFAIQPWMLVLVTGASAVLLAALIWVNGERSSAVLSGIVLAGSGLRYLVLALGVGVALLAVPGSAPGRTADCLAATYISHVPTALRDLVLAMILVFTDRPDAAFLAVVLVDPFVVLGVYLAFLILHRLGWSTGQAVLAGTLLWSSDIAGRIAIDALF